MSLVLNEQGLSQDRWDEQLSIGEQQRLSVARVLVQKPLYVLADEAFIST